MSPILNALGIDQLSLSDRITLVGEIWQSIAEETSAVPLTEPQQQDLQRRLEAHRANPEAGSSWEEVKTRLRRQS